jgi:uncharacterized protein YdeI (YjbR/CyaY-like superfamily)
VPFDAKAEFGEARPPVRCTKEYARWIEEAKRDDTRERRVRKAIAMLHEGVQHP